MQREKSVINWSYRNLVSGPKLLREFGRGSADLRRPRESFVNEQICGFPFWGSLKHVETEVHMTMPTSSGTYKYIFNSEHKYIIQT